jgi:hypothetical protein
MVYEKSIFKTLLLRNICHTCIYKPREQIALKRYADFVKPSLHKILAPCMKFMIVVLTSNHQDKNMDGYMSNASISVTFSLMLHD